MPGLPGLFGSIWAMEWIASFLLCRLLLPEIAKDANVDFSYNPYCPWGHVLILFSCLDANLLILFINVFNIGLNFIYRNLITTFRQHQIEHRILDYLTAKISICMRAAYCICVLLLQNFQCQRFKLCNRCLCL